MAVTAGERRRLDATLSRLGETRAALYAALRALRGPAYSAARPDLERLVDTENVAGSYLSQIYNVDIWGSGPGNFPTPEEAVSALIDARETLAHTLVPALDEHLDHRFPLSDGGEWSISAALEALLAQEQSLLARLSSAG